MRLSRPEWENIVFGKTNLPICPRINYQRKAKSCIAYNRARAMYRDKGFAETKNYINILQDRYDPIRVSSGETCVLIARSQLVSLRILGKLFRESRLCLPQAVSLAAGLIALGLPAEIVVGKSGHKTSIAYNFHAWVEIYGVPINATPMEQVGFVCVLRHPLWGGE